SPVRRSIASSRSVNSQPSLWARSRPIVVLPAAMNPIRTTRVIGSAAGTPVKSSGSWSVTSSTGLCMLVPPPALDLGEVAVEVAAYLGHRVAPELFQHGVGQHDRDHGLRDHGGGGEGDDVAPFPDRVRGLVGPEIDALEGPHEAGE